MKLLVASAFAIGLGLMAVSAQAMPAYPLDRPASNEVIQVAQGFALLRGRDILVEPDRIMKCRLDRFETGEGLLKMQMEFG